MVGWGLEGGRIRGVLQTILKPLAHVGVRACVVISTRVVMSARGWVGACVCALRGRVCG